MEYQTNGYNGYHQSSQALTTHPTPNVIVHSHPSMSESKSCSPTSTSGVPKFNEGDDVLLRDKKDGLVYLGIAVEIDEPSGMCLVRFGDGEERWGRLGRDVKSLEDGDTIDDDDEILENNTNDILEEETRPPSILNKQGGESRQTKHTAKESRPPKRPKGNTWQRSHSLKKVPKETPAHVLRARKELPYDFDSLLWDENHQRNDKER